MEAWSPKSPDWDSESVQGTDEKEGIEYDMWNVRYVLEGSSWVRVFLVPDVLCMRTTAAEWKRAGLFGPFAELYFFLMKEDVKNGPLPRSEPPSMRYDHRQLFGFDPKASCMRAVGKVTWSLHCLRYCVEPGRECFWTMTVVE